MQTLFDTLGIVPKKIHLYELAFVHKSFSNENELESNERLEFLGDAVLELVVTEYLFKHFPDLPEGKLTAFRSALVRKPTLAELGTELNLGKYLKLSKGEKRTGGQKKEYLLANAVEALLGAIFLDKGIVTAKKCVEKFLTPKLKKIMENEKHIGPKTRLQEFAQAELSTTPRYFDISAEGPDHCRIFTVAVFVKDKKIAEGKGSSKKKAEEQAAFNAMNVFLEISSENPKKITE